MTKLTKSKERVSKHGEVFTPEWVVKDMIALIPDDNWGDISQITLEPTCGNGNFIVEIIRKKVSCGLSIEQAIRTTYGLDIMEDNIIECRERVLNICKEHDVDIELCKKIIEHNIFVVKDSIEFMKSGEWERYPEYA